MHARTDIGSSGVGTPMHTWVGGEDSVRITIYVPDDLGEQVRSADMNVSAVAQEALRRRLECDHERLTCSACGDGVGRDEVAGGAMAELWQDMLWRWEPLVDRGGTAEGAARVARDVAVRHGVPRADRIPLPRPSRAMREAS